NVEQKGKTFVPFLAKYVFITSHKPSEEAFNFHRFRGMWHDELDQCTTELIFHKGLEEDFHNMLWNIKYDKGEYTCEELRTIIQELNKDQDELLQQLQLVLSSISSITAAARKKQKFVNDSEHEIEIINDNST
ncbi:6986_t:CDS:2, partial [Dentiscutata heterogama]